MVLALEQACQFYQMFNSTLKSGEVTEFTRVICGAYLVPEPGLRHYSQLVKGPASAMSICPFSDRKRNTQVTFPTEAQLFPM